MTDDFDSHLQDVEKKGNKYVLYLSAKERLWPKWSRMMTSILFETGHFQLLVQLGSYI